jgi:glucosamine--fructose-6-phosphate aminotransferase (isomerizing)
METSYVPALAFSAADLVHGPMAMVSAGSAVVAIQTAGPGGDSMSGVRERLDSIGADVLLVGAPDGLPLHTDGVDQTLLPILEILPLQQLAWQLALDRGYDPDSPRGLSKVTQTW